MFQQDSPAEQNGGEEPGKLSVSELISLAGSEGCEIMDRQVERWHKEEDLLPHPQQVHVPGIRGSRTLYPAATGPQLRTLCQLVKQNEGQRPNFDEWRILLWLQGYAIPIDRVRRSIQALALPSLRVLRRVLPKGSVHFRDHLEAAEHLARELLPYLRQAGMGGIIREQLPEIPDQLSFLTMQIQLLLGDTPAFDSVEEYIDPDIDARDKSLPELALKTYGLQRAQTDRILGTKPWLPLNFIPSLMTLAKSGIIYWRHMRRVLMTATAEELKQARIDRQVWFVALPQVARAVEAIFGENALGFGIFRLIDDMMPKDDVAVQAFQIVAALMLRNAAIYDTQIAEGIDQLLQVLPQQALIADHMLKVQAALRKEMPEAATLLMCDIQTAQTQESYERHLSRVRSFYNEHKSQMEAFWARHPDLYTIPSNGTSGRSVTGEAW